ncbi:hypothetical protein [Microcoleus sp. N3A4]|uniref:hypothetical protein n=1 Tax=Microcoleus sp. N3A4 TaxID=3055379 RepID=UPI002FD32B24
MSTNPIQTKSINLRNGANSHCQRLHGKKCDPLARAALTANIYKLKNMLRSGNFTRTQVLASLSTNY